MLYLTLKAEDCVEDQFSDCVEHSGARRVRFAYAL